MAIDSTAGGVAADSYVDIATADAYADTKLYVAEWTDATTADKERALKMSTVELDRMDWKGDLKDPTTPQRLRWPRANVLDLDGSYLASTTIPRFLEEATVELAIGLLKKDRYAESDNVGIRKVQAAEVAVSFDRKDTNTRNPITMLQMIKPYLNSGGGVGNWTLLLRA
jgi:hypothetical protein